MQTILHLRPMREDHLLPGWRVTFVALLYRESRDYARGSPMATSLVNRSIECCRADEEHLDSSRRLLALSRRLLGMA
jgi:hypothetical protein